MFWDANPNGNKTLPGDSRKTINGLILPNSDFGYNVIIMKLICYCHGYSEADIIADVKKNNGESSIMHHIIESKGNNTCQCDVKHPDKR